jgi:hypothetical protein
MKENGLKLLSPFQGPALRGVRFRLPSDSPVRLTRFAASRTTLGSDVYRRCLQECLCEHTASSQLRDLAEFEGTFWASVTLFSLGNSLLSRNVSLLA